MKVAVVVYPGSNADWDALHALRDAVHADASYVFHKEKVLPANTEAVVVPGGFSYGDYLRAGAIARFSPISASICQFASRGGPVLGICNGFQILTELGLLPGALTRNAQLRFECRDVFVRREGEGLFTSGIPKGAVLRLPIAHADGRYVCDPATLTRLEDSGQIAFRYASVDGTVGADTVNGSLHDIAGVYNEARNVMGLMPHPERASEAILGNTDGLRIFECLREHIHSRDALLQFRHL